MLDQVERFYSHFENMIKEHKNGILSSLKYDFETKTSSIKKFKAECITPQI